MKTINYINPVTKKSETVSVDIDAGNITLGFDAEGNLVFKYMLIDLITGHSEGDESKSVIEISI